MWLFHRPSDVSCPLFILRFCLAREVSKTNSVAVELDATTASVHIDKRQKDRFPLPVLSVSQKCTKDEAAALK